MGFEEVKKNEVTGGEILRALQELGLGGMQAWLPFMAKRMPHYILKVVD